MELKRKIAGVRAKEDRVNRDILEANANVIERLIEEHNDTLPNSLKNNKQKIIDLLS